jgi:hypothetical protein
MDNKQEDGTQAKKFRKYVRSRFSFPSYNFGTALQLADKVEYEGGGRLTDATLAISLKASAKSSGFRLRTLAARQFGLLDKQGEMLVTTTRAKAILKPLSPDEKKGHMVNSFMAVPLFSKVAERFKGQPLPPVPQFKNILERELGVESNRSGEAYKVLMDSASQTGVLHQTGDKIYIVAEGTSSEGLLPETSELATESQNVTPRSDKPSMPSRAGVAQPTAGVFAFSEEDLAEFNDTEFDEIWKSLGKIIRVRGKRRQGAGD